LFGMYSTAMKEMMLYPEKGKKENFRKGGLYEALIADMLIKNGYQELFFRKDEASTSEIEFMIETTAGPVPSEVKSANSKSKSLDNILKREDIPYGYKLIDGNVGIVDKKITLPLYMAMFL
ncbi:MAG: AAA family ATPase, partial [Lachnospiraceae bacterium]|nr:AAA family ATPase [Lachnospiraceae bacterium]